MEKKNAETDVSEKTKSRKDGKSDNSKKGGKEKGERKTVKSKKQRSNSGSLSVGVTQFSSQIFVVFPLSYLSSEVLQI